MDNSRPLLWASVLTTAIFIADVALPQEENIAFFYLFPIILGLFFQERSDVFLLGVVATVLTLIAIFIRPQSDLFNELLLGRGRSLAGIWAGVFLVIKILSLRIKEQIKSEQFLALFKFASNGIVIINQNGDIERVNPAAEKLFGYNAGEMTGNKIESLIPSRLTKVHQRHRQDYQHNPHPRAMGSGLNLTGKRKDGSEFPVEVSLSPFTTARGRFVMAFVADNTVRTENEQRILRQNQRLEQLAGALQNLNENLEERIRERTRALEQARNELSVALSKERELGELKSRFVSMASHEFRTPLSTVLSSAALITSYADRGDIPNIQKHALRIKNSVNNLNTILTEFLSLGKLEEGKTSAQIRSMNLSTCVEEVHNELKLLFKPGQSLDYRHEGAEDVFLDPALLKHALVNLVANSIKYSPENKPVSVLTRVTEQEIEIHITDQGMGIPESEQKHLFSRFFRASNAANIQGTGLGMYIVKRYVELMNGVIGFESEEGKGTSVWMRFPNQSPENVKTGT
jgi:PAS domain S-box-containing protein